MSCQSMVRHRRARRRMFSSSRPGFVRGRLSSDNLRGRTGSEIASAVADAARLLDTSVRRSTIAGHGLFAKTVLPVGTTLGWYRGRLLTRSEAKASGSDSILRLQIRPWWVTRADWKTGYTYVDAKGGTDQQLRFVNSSKGTGRAANVRMRDNGEFRTIDEVCIGEEMLMDYDHGEMEADTSDDNYHDFSH